MVRLSQFLSTDDYSWPRKDHTSSMSSKKPGVTKLSHSTIIIILIPQLLTAYPSYPKVNSPQTMTQRLTRTSVISLSQTKLERFLRHTAKQGFGVSSILPLVWFFFIHCCSYPAQPLLQAYKAVGESTEIPLTYYANNVAATISLLQIMAEYDCKRIVYSSSATVYGTPPIIPIPETTRLQADSPYGKTKVMVENIIDDLCHCMYVPLFFWFVS